MLEPVLTDPRHQVDRHEADAFPPTPDAQPDPWSQITTRMKAGDKGAFSQYYEAYFDIMYREACRCLGHRHEACADVVQDAMLKVMRYIKPIGDAQQLARFSRAVVRSVAHDWLRRQSRHRRLITSVAEDRASSQPELEDPAEDLHDDFQIRALWLAEQLKQLDPDLRKLLDWRFRWGWTLRQIAERIGVKTGTVDGRIRRAIERLRQQAQEEFDE